MVLGRSFEFVGPLKYKPDHHQADIALRSHLPVHEAEKHQPLQLKVRCYTEDSKPLPQALNFLKSQSRRR